MKSIKCQFQHSINMNFRENIDKHAQKQNGAISGSTSIYSYNEKFRLLDVSSNLSNFLKANYPNVKYIRDIQPTHIQEFLNSKKDCTQQSINSYIQSLKKLERVANKCYGLSNNNMSKIVAPIVTKKQSELRGATHPITQSNYEKILTYCLNNPSKSGDCLLLNYACSSSHAFRVQELARIKIDNIAPNGMITIDNAKGGKTYMAHCPNLDFLQVTIRKQYDPNGKLLFGINGNSINKYLSRVCDKLGIDEKYSFHDIRRFHAQEFYDNLRNNGYDIKNATLETSKYLGHNTPRERMMTQSYITIW